MIQPTPVNSSFKPAWWLPGPHLQTLWPYCIRRHSDLPLRRERLELPDGDFVDLCWAGEPAGSSPVVALFHGLEGSIDSPYARPMLKQIRDAGWCGVFMHFRGCSGEPNRLARSYHSGDTGDIRFLLATLSRRFPAAPLAAIGYSLGGNALLKYLGEAGEAAPLRCAVAISVPFLLANGARRLNRGLSRIYQRHLLGLLQLKVLAKFKTRPAPVDVTNVTGMNTFYRFDDSITAPLHGFNSADDYYSRCSSRRFLGAVRVPTLILHSRDDPFMTPEAIPEPGELSKHVTLELSAGGGHVGFIAGRVPGRAVYWLEQRVPEFIRSFF